MVAPAQLLIDEFGLDALCERIADGESMTAIAHSIGVSFGTLSTWIAAKPERSARARECRLETARLWDEEATRRIEQASDTFELSRAKELAHHFRWRASKIAPKEYGDKVTQEHTGADGKDLPAPIVQFVRAEKPSGGDPVS